MGANRLEAFSDGVIAIIITIMVLDFKVPHEAGLHPLRLMFPSLLYYALSFVLIAIYWVNHHHLIALAAKVDAPLLWSNIYLLFWLSLMPFATAYMAEHHWNPLAPALYGTIQIGCSTAWFLLQKTVARTYTDDPAKMNLYRIMCRKNHIATGIIILAVGMAFISIPISKILLIVPPIMYFIPDRRVERHVAEDN